MRFLPMLLLLLVCGCSQPAQVAGTYVGTVDETNLKPEIKLTVQQTGVDITGKGSETFRIPQPQTAEFNFTGKVKGNHMEIRVTKDGGGEAIFEGVVDKGEYRGEVEFKNSPTAPQLPGSTLRVRPFLLRRQ